MRRLFWIAALASVAACHRGDGLARVEVGGTVKYQNSPVEHGQITFHPDKGTGGPAAGAAIVNGSFRIPFTKGPTPGPHEIEVKIVDISSSSAKNTESAAMTHGVQQVNSFSQHVDITNGRNQFNFAFPSDPSPARH